MGEIPLKRPWIFTCKKICCQQKKLITVKRSISFETFFSGFLLDQQLGLQLNLMELRFLLQLQNLLLSVWLLQLPTVPSELQTKKQLNPVNYISLNLHFTTQHSLHRLLFSKQPLCFKKSSTVEITKNLI